MFNLEIRSPAPKMAQSPQSSVLSAAVQLPAVQQLRAVTLHLPAVPQLSATPPVFSAAVAGSQSSHALPIHTLHTPRRQAVQRERPGPRRQPISAAPRWIPPAAATPSRAKRARTTEFKLGVLAWAHHTRLEDGKGGLRQPTREEVRRRFGLKSINQISKWKRVS
jgi:hypothetical protein